MTMPDGYLANLYFFNAAPLRPIVIVAVAGHRSRDWAAYCAGIDEWGEPGPELWQQIRQLGYKLTESQARGFFPNIERPYRP